jgi:hypothetical protein
VCGLALVANYRDQTARRSTFFGALTATVNVVTEATTAWSALMYGVRTFGSEWLRILRRRHDLRLWQMQRSNTHPGRVFCRVPVLGGKLLVTRGLIQWALLLYPFPTC